MGCSPWLCSSLPTEQACTCEVWFQLTFRPQKWNLKAHMWCQLSPFPSSNAAIAMQHHPGNIPQSFATPRYSATPCYVSIQLPNVIDRISKWWRSKKAFNTSPCHIFSKQTPTPSRFKFILLINNGIDWKDRDSCSFQAKNFGRSLEGQGGPTRGSKVFNTIILKWKPATCAKTHKLLCVRNTSSNHLELQKADRPSFSGKRSSHQTQLDNKKLTSSGFKQQPLCTPLASTRNKIIYKTACSNGPNSGSGKPSQNRLRSKGPP